jgi:hypothetical protein
MNDLKERLDAASRLVSSEPDGYERLAARAGPPAAARVRRGGGSGSDCGRLRCPYRRAPEG